MAEALVIGGGGFVGSHLVQMLIAKGHSVRIFSRRAGLGGTISGVQYFRGEIADKPALRKVVEGVDAVFDLAGNPMGTWDEMRRTYVEGARTVADACLEYGVKRLVYASSTAAIDWSLRSTMDENAGTDPKAHLVPGYYHIAKTESEHLLLEMHAKAKLPVVILRPAIVLGPGGRLCHDGIGTWRDDTCCLVVGKGSHPLGFVLVQDVAAAFIAAMTAPVEGRVFNLAGDVRPSAIEMVGYIRQRSRRNFRAFPQSLYKLHALAWAKFMIKLAVGKEGDRPSWHYLECQQVLTQLDCSAAKKDLGWQPVSDLETFLCQAVDSHLRPIPPGDLRNSLRLECR